MAINKFVAGNTDVYDLLVNVKLVFTFVAKL